MTDFYMPHFFVLSSVSETVAQAVCKSRGLRASECVSAVHGHSLAEERGFEVHCQKVCLGQRSAVCG